MVKILNVSYQVFLKLEQQEIYFRREIRKLSDQKTFDPFMLWKDYYRNVETYWGKTLEENMQKEEFSEWLGKVVDLNMLYKQMVDKSAKQYLEQMNLPSRDDLSSLSSLIVNLDAKVDDMEDRLEENIESQLSSAVLKREMTSLKKDVKDLSSKLDDILHYLTDSQKKEVKEPAKVTSPSAQAKADNEKAK